jgi:scyllo-inositol 2-dehydrogenase (NADP+)
MDRMSQPPIRVAVLGYGLAGRVFHCPFISAVPGLELAAIAFRTADSAAQNGPRAAADYPATRILTSLDAAFDDPAIDLIVVATPNETHFDLAAKALRSGKHVVVDKPLTGTSAKARELITLATQHGKLLAPFHNRRFDGDFQTLRQLIADNTLGRIVHISSHFDRFRPIQRPGSWKEAAGQSNGLLFDLGPHLIDQALALFGPPKSITASVRFERDVTAIDDAFDVTLTYDIAGHTLRYDCHASMIAAANAPRFHANGTHGSFVKYGLDPQESALKEEARPPVLGTPATWLSESESAWGTLVIAPNPSEPTDLDHAKLPTLPGDYRLFYANVRDAIHGTAPIEIPAEDAFRTIKLLELALQSSEQHRTLLIDFSE